jgi:hypothetical protein
MLAASPSRALAAVMVRAEEVFPQLRAPFLVRRRLSSEVAGVISLLSYAVVGIESAMGVHVLVADLTRSLAVSRFGVEGEPRWLPSPMVLWRPGLVAAGVIPASACVKFGGAGNQDVPSLTVDPSRVLFVNLFRTVERLSQVHDLGLNGQHGLRWHPGISGGIYERFIVLLAGALGFSQHIFFLGRHCFLSFASRFRSWFSSGGDKGSPVRRLPTRSQRPEVCSSLHRVLLAAAGAFMAMEQHSAMADEVMRKEGAEGVEASKMQDTQHEEEGEEVWEKVISDRRLVIHERGTEEES